MLRDYSKLPHPIITVIRPIAFQNLLYFNSAFIIDNLTAAKIFFVEIQKMAAVNSAVADIIWNRLKDIFPLPIITEKSQTPVIRSWQEIQWIT